MKKNNTTGTGFTLLELMIVLTLLFTLMAIAVPRLRGYLAEAKVNAVNSNHKRIRVLIATEFFNCNAGSGYSYMGSQTTNCMENVTTFSNAVKNYMDEMQVHNPYSPSVPAVLVGSAGSDTGYTYLTPDPTNELVTVTSIPQDGETLTIYISRD